MDIKELRIAVEKSAIVPSPNQKMKCQMEVSAICLSMNTYSGDTGPHLKNGEKTRGESNLQQCSEGSVNIEEVVKQDQELQEASVCETPKTNFILFF